MNAPRLGTVTLALGALFVSAGALAPTLTSAAPAATAARSAAGSLQRGFGRGGIVSTGGATRLFGVVLAHSGKGLAVGQTGGQHPRVLLLRFKASGALDHGFGSRGRAVGPHVSGPRAGGSVGRALAIEPDGKIVVVGKVTGAKGVAAGILVERYSVSGHLDRGFGAHGVVEIEASALGDGYGVAVQRDGRIVVAGSADANGSGGFSPRVTVARLNRNGSLDRSFAGHGAEIIDLGPFSVASALALTRSGQIVIAGSTSPGLQAPKALIARLTRSGSLDRGFVSSAHQYARGASSSTFNALAVQRDGKIVAAGAATHGNNAADAIIARFTAGGRPDGGFGSGGVAYAGSAIHFTLIATAVPGASGVTVGPGGRIYAAGQELDSVQSKAAVWAFSSRGAPDHGFGAGGVVLTNYARTPESEAAAIALAPGGDLITAGDRQSTYGGAYTGVLARYKTTGR